MRPVITPRNEFQYRGITKHLIDQCIDIILNLRQSGHSGAFRFKVYDMVATLLSGAIRLDIRDTGKKFAKERLHLLNKL